MAKILEFKKKEQGERYIIFEDSAGEFEVKVKDLLSVAEGEMDYVSMPNHDRLSPLLVNSLLEDLSLWQESVQRK